MNLEDHLKSGGVEPADLEQLPNGRWRDPVDGWVGMTFQFNRVGDEWLGENRYTILMRTAVAFGQALAGEKPPPWDIARQRAYLAAWPINQQMEALADAAQGRPEKLARMQADFAAIKAANPKP